MIFYLHFAVFLQNRFLIFYKNSKISHKKTLKIIKKTGKKTGKKNWKNLKNLKKAEKPEKKLNFNQTSIPFSFFSFSPLPQILSHRFPHLPPPTPPPSSHLNCIMHVAVVTRTPLMTQLTAKNTQHVLMLVLIKLPFRKFFRRI